ncbi:MAG: O-antigen ligase family protein, partial [Patescibacteria group bacterium]
AERYLPVADAVGILLLGAWILRLIRDRSRRSIRVPAGWAIGLFLLSASLSLLNTSDLVASTQFVLRPLFFFLVVFVILPVNEIKSTTHLVQLMKEMAIIGIGFIAMGMVSLLVMHQPESIPRVVPLPIFGHYFLGGNHNEFAEVLIGFLPIFWFFSGVTKIAHHRQAWGIVLVSGVGIALLTLSRAAWIAVAVQGGIMGVLYYRRAIIRNIQRAWPVFFLALIPLGWLMLNLLTSRVGYLANANRLFLVQIALDVFEQHPWIGAGAGTFLSWVAADRYYLMDFGTALDAHGILWKLLPEMGLLGVISFFGMSAAFFWIAWKQIKTARRTTEGRLLFTLFLSALGVWVFELFGTSYYIA